MPADVAGKNVKKVLLAVTPGQGPNSLRAKPKAMSCTKRRAKLHPKAKAKTKANELYLVIKRPRNIFNGADL